MIKVIVVGNGMVGYKFCEKFIAKSGQEQYQITVFGEEPRPAYDRVHLSEFFAGKSADDLSLVAPGFFDKGNVAIKLNAKVTAVDRAAKNVTVGSGEVLAYDKLVFATGSYPFVPPLPGKDRPHCFVYRTIEDLQAIRAAAAEAKIGTV